MKYFLTLSKGDNCNTFFISVEGYGVVLIDLDVKIENSTANPDINR